MSSAIAVTDATFEAEVLKSSIPVVVDFWAEWCGPCRMLSPVIDELAAENAGKVKFVKVNVDENPGIAGQYGIRGIPTLLLFKGGNLSGNQVGVSPKDKLQSWFDGAL